MHPWLIAGAVSLVAGFTDLRSRRIPNWLTYPAAVVGLLLGLWPENDPQFWQSFAGCALGLLPGIVLFAVGGLGGGDVKLLAAIGALVGYPRMVEVLVLTTVAGTAIGLVALLWRPATVPSDTPRLPLAVAVAIGTIWAAVGPSPIALSMGSP